MRKQGGVEMQRSDLLVASLHTNTHYVRNVLSSHGLHRSTFDDAELNCRVRNGIGCTLCSKVTHIVGIQVSKIFLHPDGRIVDMNDFEEYEEVKNKELDRLVALG